MTVLVFPSLPGLTFPAKRKPVWSTIKHDALSGKRTRFSLWTYPIWKFELTFSFLRSDQTNFELQTLVNFVNEVLGAGTLWAYNDTLTPDNSVTAQTIGTGDGATLGPYQLVRSFGGFVEPVFLVNGTPTILVNGSAVNPANYTISAYGAVTFNSGQAPGNGQTIAWTGSFYFPCRFDEDELDFDQFMGLIWETKSVKFSSEKLP